MIFSSVLLAVSGQRALFMSLRVRQMEGFLQRYGR